MKFFRQPIALPILSGFLIGTSYIPFPPWAIFFCMVPLWLYWVEAKSWKQVFLAGWLTQFILNAIGFHWIAYTVHEFGQMPWIAGIGVQLIFCSFAHLYYPISGCLWFGLKNKFKLTGIRSWLLIPFLFLLVERLYPFIFYWHLGYPWLWARFPGAQAAEWIGFYGLNVLTVFVNFMVFVWWKNRKTSTDSKPFLYGAIATVIVINLAGWIAESRLQTPEKVLKVIAVQGNIGNLDKLQQTQGGHPLAKAVNRFVDLSREALVKYPDADVMVWPETAFPETIYPNKRRYHLGRVTRLLKEHQVDLISGAYQRFPQRTPKPYNSMVLITREGEILEGYQKTHLLAYGEYFPGGETFPVLKKWFPMVSDFGRGKGAHPFKYGDIRIGGQICYEGLFDDFSAELQTQGAQIIVNITNDSWFGYPFEPFQHMYMTLARAIETRRPLIRVTNTGTTSAITASGKRLEFSPHDEEWYGYYEIPYSDNPRNTLYPKIVYLWPWLFLIAIIAIIGGSRFARASKH